MERNITSSQAYMLVSRNRIVLIQSTVLKSRSNYSIYGIYCDWSSADYDLNYMPLTSISISFLFIVLTHLTFIYSLIRELLLSAVRFM